VQSNSASIEGNILEKTAGWQARFWRPIIELSASLPGEFPEQQAERFGLLTRMATESVLSFAPMKSCLRF